MPDIYFPRDPDNPVSVGHYALIAGDVATAERASRDALRANPHSIPARINLAAALELSGDLHEALLEYPEAASRSRSNLRALVALGSAFRRRTPWMYACGDVRSALKKMNRSIELNPRAPLSHWALGRMPSDWNRAHEALFHLREATLLDPNDPDFWFDPALAEERAGHLLASRHALNMALKLTGDSSAGHTELNDLATRLDHAFIAMERTNAEDVVATGPDGFGCEQCRVTPRAGKRPPVERKRAISPPGQMQYALARCENCRQTHLELRVGIANSGRDAHGEWRAWVPLLGREVDDVDTALTLAAASDRPVLLDRLMRAASPRGVSNRRLLLV